MPTQDEQIIKEKFQELYGVTIDNIIYRNGEYLLKAGTDKANANKLSLTLRNEFKINGSSPWGTKEIGYFKGHVKGHFHISLSQDEIDSLIPRFEQLESIKSSQSASVDVGVAASLSKHKETKKDPIKIIYGNDGLNSDLNQLQFTKEDHYVSPRKQNGSRELTKEAQKAGRMVMDLVGTTADRPGFVNKEHSPLKALKDNGGSIKVGNATYRSEMLKKSLDSVRVFYDNSISENDIVDSLKARDASVTYKDKKPVSDNLTNIAGHRVMTSKGHIFNNNKFAPLDKMVEVTIMDASAPDLNTQLNKTIYLQNGTLNATKYKAEMLSRVKLLIKAAEANGCTTIVLPSIGAGAFANGNAQEVATIIATCFKEILTKSSNITLKNIVFSVMGDHLKYYNNIFHDYKGDVNVMLTEAEMTNVAIKLSELPNENVAYVIAGHPTQKIGNGWKVDQNGCSAEAQEETCTKHFVDFIASLDASWNPQVLTKLVPVNIDSDVIPDAGLIAVSYGQFYAAASPHGYDDHDYDEGGAGGEASFRAPRVVEEFNPGDFLAAMQRCDVAYVKEAISKLRPSSSNKVVSFEYLYYKGKNFLKISSELKGNDGSKIYKEITEYEYRNTSRFPDSAFQLFDGYLRSDGASSEEALHKAILKDNVPLVAEILKNGVDLSFMDPVSNLTALGLALEMGRNEIVQMICNHEAQKDNSDDEGGEAYDASPSSSSSAFNAGAPGGATFDFLASNSSSSSSSSSSSVQGSASSSSSSSSSVRGGASLAKPTFEEVCSLVEAKEFSAIEQIFFAHPSQELLSWINMALESLYIRVPDSFINNLEALILSQDDADHGADDIPGDHYDYRDM